MRETLPTKSADRRNTRLNVHLATDYSQCVGVKAIGAKQVKPVVFGDELLVETEFGCLALSEVFGDAGYMPSQAEVAEKLAETRAETRRSEDVRGRYQLPVCSTQMMGKGRSERD